MSINNYTLTPAETKRVNAKIEKINKVFKKASKTEKRVIIAKEVLSRIANEKFFPKKGAFVISRVLDELMTDYEGDSYKEIPPNPELKDVSVQSLLLADKLNDCSVCALGGMVLACTIHNNKTTIAKVRKELYGLGNCVETDKKISNGLNLIFTKRQLVMIETAFEGGCGYFDDDLHNKNVGISKNQFNRLLDFYGRFEFSEERLKAIMKNIVDNEGTFKP